MLDQKIELLQQVPLFSRLSQDLLTAIAGSGQKRFFEAGESLIAEGEPGNAAYLIMTRKGWLSQNRGRRSVDRGSVAWHSRGRTRHAG